MVKAHIQKTGGKDAVKKKLTSITKKKTSDSSSWPCRIAGCNKVFAREADLKRHQRTTKTHTAPGFQCPQCDATFTRTDALRRHQKSRHNGVVLEPTEATQEDDEPPSPTEAGPSVSRSSSRSPSPVESESSGSEEPEPKPKPKPTKPSASAISKSVNYYRPHTMQIGYPPPRPPPVILDPNYPPPVAIPTSAARLQHPTWTPPHSAWSPDGSPLPPGYPLPPYYPPPSPYYRSHVMPTVHPPSHMYSEYLHHYPPPHIPYGGHPPLSTVTGAPPAPFPPPPRMYHHPDGDTSSEGSSPSPVEEHPREDRMGSSPSNDPGTASRPSSSTPKSPIDNTSEGGSKMNAKTASFLKTSLENGATRRSDPSQDEVMSQSSSEDETHNDPPFVPGPSSDRALSP